MRPVPLIAVILGVAILLGLGMWQVKRLAWKEDLLARIAALQLAPPEPLDVVLHRLAGPSAGERGQVDFVPGAGRLPDPAADAPVIHLYALLQGVLGDRLITACPIAAGPYRSILVDRGFVAEERVGHVAPGAPISTPIVGVLRRPEPHSWVTPVNPPDPADGGGPGTFPRWPRCCGRLPPRPCS